MFHCGNVHEEVVVIDFVQDTIRALPYSIPAAMKLLDSLWSRLLSKLVDPMPYRVPKFFGNRIEGFERFPLDVNPIHNLGPSQPLLGFFPWDELVFALFKSLKSF